MIIGKTSFNYYGVLIVLSMFVGAFYIYYSIKKEGFKNKEHMFLYFMLFFSSVIILGKMFTVIVSDENVNLLNAGFSSYGGLIGVILSSFIFEKIVPFDNKIIKYSIISLPLSYSIGKIGCFIAGCCYGIPYNGFLSVTYTNGLNIPLFPVQLIEAIIFMILFLIFNHLKNNKNIIYITIILSALMKFLLDFLRYEHLTKTISVNQVFSLILIFCMFILILKNKKQFSK